MGVIEGYLELLIVVSSFWKIAGCLGENCWEMLLGSVWRNFMVPSRFLRCLWLLGFSGFLCEGG